MNKLGLITLLLLALSSCSENLGPGDCNYLEESNYTVSENSGVQIFTPTVISPDADSIHHLVISIRLMDTITDEYLALEIDELNFEVFDKNKQSIFQSAKVNILKSNCDGFNFLYLWDGKVNDISHSGEFFFDINIEFNDSLFINGIKENMISWTCQDIEFIMSDPSQCELNNFRFTESITPNCSHGITTFSDCN